MTEVQSKLLKMLEWFHSFCGQNEISYYIVGGTMLGAARHQGFIPWDDDIDVGILREDYDKLLGLGKKLKGRYIIESPHSGNTDYLYSFSKLYDTTTTYIEELRFQCKRGIYIDIFPLDAIGSSFEEASNNLKLFDRKNMFLMTRTCAIKKGRSWYKNLSIVVSRLIPSFFINEKKLSVELDNLSRGMNRSSNSYVANLNGAYRDREIVEKRILGNPTLYGFENIQVYGPQFYDEYLTGLYGNWRKLPPEEKRVLPHNYIVCDLNKSYLDKSGG